MSIFLLFIISFPITFDILLLFSISVSVLLINYSFIDLITSENIDIIKIHILSIFSNFKVTMFLRYYFIF